MQTLAKQKTLLGLLGMLTLAAYAFVIMRPGTAEGPKVHSVTCNSCPTSSLAAARRAAASAAGLGPQAEPALPPGAIDGAKNPELIPDDIAYKMLFLSIMEPQNPTDAQKARQEAKLRMIGLSDDDKAGFLAKVGEFRDRLNDLGTQTQGILKATPKPARDSAEWQELSDIEQQTNTAVTDTVEALRAGLTQEGFAKFQARMLAFKRTIKAFPTPNSQSGE
jgi:hypothetical protein